MKKRNIWKNINKMPTCPSCSHTWTDVMPTLTEVQEFVELWNTVLGGKIHKIMGLSENRRLKCKLRLKERSLKEWRRIFEIIGSTPFLLGQSKEGWRASFDWIIANSDNALKVIEGKYGTSYQLRQESEDAKKCRLLSQGKSPCHGTDVFVDDDGIRRCVSCVREIKQ